MEIYLIRHGKTKGNLEKRYIGRTDEELLPESRVLLREKKETLHLNVEQVYTSPLCRCRQTADILFPKTPLEIEENLRETDFGDFEYLTYEDLKEKAAYRAWIDSMGMGPVPNGESGLAFRERCAYGFASCLCRAARRGQKRIAFTIHGGTIMAVLARFADEKKDFYDWQISNGSGYKAVWKIPDERKLQLLKKCEPEQEIEELMKVIRLQVENKI